MTAGSGAGFSPDPRPLGWYRGRKVTVMGLGLFGGGRGAVDFLVRRGAEVTVTDLRPLEKLAPAVERSATLPVRWVLGEHREEDFAGADLVIVNPAVPRTAPLLARCRELGVPLETEMNLFFKHARGRLCAVTGSNGKTTTTSLIGAMARRRWPGTRVGGNLGLSLLPDAETIGAEEWVVLELSSFQLEDLAPLERRPEVSLITNLSPNHLDRHGSYEEYLRAKREIIARGPSPNVAVLCGEDAVLRSWAMECPRRAVRFARTGDVIPRAEGVWIDETRGLVTAGANGARRLLFESRDLRLRGRFNLLNAAGAAAAALAMGVEPREIRDAVREFRPVEHRLELFLERRGVEHYDDSIATTPESTIGALEALGPDVLLICGGSAKGCDFRRLGAAIASGTKAVFLIGATAGAIEDAIRCARRPAEIHRSGTLAAAVAAARATARPGDRILLSPACPSYDQFVNFEERGRRFKELCRADSAPS